jgi:hypothetical protein
MCKKPQDFEQTILNINWREKMKGLSLIVLCILVGGCATSASVSEGYGPKGETYFGGPYGYQDTRLGNGNFMVSYSGTDAFNAKTGLNKRASELCSGGNYVLLNSADAQQSGGSVSTAAVGGGYTTSNSSGPFDAVAEVRCE